MAAKTTLVFAVLLQGATASAQEVQGVVVERHETKGELPVLFANVHWQGTTIGASTNPDGEFTLPPPPAWPARLIISHIQYTPDTVVLNIPPSGKLRIVLKKSVTLGAVTKEGRRKTTSVSTLDPAGAHHLGTGELRKAACCNLSESFETNAAVDVVFTDAVSGSKKIQMLGLDGVYTQILAENLPLVRGMSSPYGLSFIPGTWIESIQITKGAGSVLNGYESITGQINLEYFKPYESEKLFINLFGDHQLRHEANVHHAARVNPKWSTMTFGHYHKVGTRVDHDGDDFLDMPLSQQVNVFNRWNYNGEQREMQLGAGFMDWETTGGQTTFRRGEESDTSGGYGVGVNIRQYSFFGKNGFFFPGNAFRSIGIMTALKRTEQSSFFGLRTYEGEHDNAYVNVIYQSLLSNSFNIMKAGVSFQHDGYRENFMDSSFSSVENVPGAFAEYTYNDSVRYALVAGVRADYHDDRVRVSPRLHAKYNIRPLTAIRLSGGKGFRTPHVIAENSQTLASSRKVITGSGLRAEEAWNYGASLQHKFLLFARDASLMLDYYRTDFVNQVVADLDQGSGMVAFYNLDGRSYANSFHADFEVEVAERLDIRLSAKRYDTKITYGGILRRRPLAPKHRALGNISWASDNEKWKLDFTVNWFGESRIPSTADKPEAYRRELTSDRYYLLNTQVTKEFRLLEAYVGMENLTNYTQKDAIIAAGDPFGPHFDASLVWGPLNGRVLYGGIRMKFE